MNPTDLIRQKVERFLTQAKVPTLPAVAQKLLQMCTEDQANFAELAQIIKSDQGLAARVLQTANSAYYGLRQKANTIEKAVSILGINYVKSVCLGFQLVAALGKCFPPTFNVAEFWQQAILRGLLARRLAMRCCPQQQEQASLVGLLLDMGIPLLLQVLGDDYLPAWNNNRRSPGGLCQAERAAFDYDHPSAAAALGQLWGLPDLLVKPIRLHHGAGEFKADEPDLLLLCQIAFFAGNVDFPSADPFLTQGADLRAYARTNFHLADADLQTILEEVQQEYARTSEFLGVSAPHELPAVTLLAQAKEALSDIHERTYAELLDYKAQVLELEHQKIQAAYSAFTTDDLTHLWTRNAVLEYVEAASAQVRAGQTSLTILFVDVDDLKHINNTYGHVAGDRYLRDFAALLQGFFQSSGCLVRYGGDEFVAALTGLQLKQALQVAQTLLAKIRRRHPDLPSLPGHGSTPFSASIGVLFCPPGSAPAEVSRLLELADQQMYRVKRESKDGIAHLVLAPAPNPTAPNPLPASPHA